MLDANWPFFYKGVKIHFRWNACLVKLVLAWSFLNNCILHDKNMPAPYKIDTVYKSIRVDLLKK